MASFQDIGRERTSPGLAFNPYTGTHAQGFCYVYNEIYHDLGKAIEGMRAFDEYVNATVHVQIDGKPYDANKHFIAACFVIEISPEGTPKA